MHRILARFTFLSKHRPQASVGCLPERKIFSGKSMSRKDIDRIVIAHLFRFCCNRKSS
jgi:hypothetical protein